MRHNWICISPIRVERESITIHRANDMINGLNACGGGKYFTRHSSSNGRFSPFIYRISASRSLRLGWLDRRAKLSTSIEHTVANKGIRRDKRLSVRSMMLVPWINTRFRALHDFIFHFFFLLKFSDECIHVYTPRKLKMSQWRGWNELEGYMYSRRLKRIRYTSYNFFIHPWEFHKIY